MDNMPISRVQIAATFVFLIALGTTLVLLSLVFLAIATNTMSGEVGGGKFYLLFIQNDDAFGFIKGLAAILSLGATTVAAPKSNNTVYYLTIFSAFISIILCVVVFIELGDSNLAHQLYDNPGGSSITSAEKLQNGTKIALGGLVTWLTGVLSLQFALKP